MSSAQEAGKDPDIWFPDMSIKIAWLSPPQDNGSVPERLLFFRLLQKTFASFAPYFTQALKNRFCSAASTNYLGQQKQGSLKTHRTYSVRIELKLPQEAGKVPDKLLSFRFKVVKSQRWAHSSGMAPVNRFPSKSLAVTAKISSLNQYKVSCWHFAIILADVLLCASCLTVHSKLTK